MGMAGHTVYTAGGLCEMKRERYTSVEQLIGRTPLLELTRLEEKLGLKARALAKLEYLHPAGSVKERVARSEGVLVGISWGPRPGRHWSWLRGEDDRGASAGYGRSVFVGGVV